MAEALWSPKAARNWDDFTSRLPSLLERYDYLGINYSKSAYLVAASSTADLEHKQVKVVLKNEFPNADIRYILDHKSLEKQATKYSDSITIKETTILKASLFKEDKPVGNVFTDTIQFHKAVGSKLNFKRPYNDYKGDGPLSLVNIIRGSKNFHDGQWQAWLVNDMEVVIDLEKIQSINQITVGSLENQGSGIYFPTEIKAFISTDGKTYKEVGKIMRPFTINSNSELKDFKISFEKSNAKFVKVIVSNLKKSPKGEDSWLFVDEILVD
jgi:hexosaminidase